MKNVSLLLPGLCLGGAALLLAPAGTTLGFSKTHSSLDQNLRDVRLLNNFRDSVTNDNNTPASQFPGATGAELAIWKAIVEWGSRPHGDGSGDPLGGNVLGSGGANFDAMWSGHSVGGGTIQDNIVSTLPACNDGGVLAFTESAFSGFRIRFCDEWVWEDGPGTVSGRYDLQGVMTHEYGHALGLGHSSVSAATMWPSTGAGSSGPRSIHADDIAGVQCVYGVASATKPIVTATVANPGANLITIHGSNFSATGNEVWFTNATVTVNAGDPIVRVVGVASGSGGTEITVPIPADAAPGDVIVKKSGSGGATISNAFPTDLVGTFGNPPAPHPVLADVTPDTLDALIPGTDRTVTLTGANLQLTTGMTVDGVAIPAARWTIVNTSTIQLDMPQVESLGAHTLGVTNGAQSSAIAVDVAAPATPLLEWGTGDAFNVVDTDLGLDMIVSGPVGATVVVRGAPGAAPKLEDLVRLALPVWRPGRLEVRALRIGDAGWESLHLDVPSPSVIGTTWYGRCFRTDVFPFDASNVQTITIVP